MQVTLTQSADCNLGESAFQRIFDQCNLIIDNEGAARITAAERLVNELAEMGAIGTVRAEFYPWECPQLKKMLNLFGVTPDTVFTVSLDAFAVRMLVAELAGQRESAGTQASEALVRLSEIQQENALLLEIIMRLTDLRRYAELTGDNQLKARAEETLSKICQTAAPTCEAWGANTFRGKYIQFKVLDGGSVDYQQAYDISFCYVGLNSSCHLARVEAAGELVTHLYFLNMLNRLATEITDLEERPILRKVWAGTAIDNEDIGATAWWIPIEIVAICRLAEELGNPEAAVGERARNVLSRIAGSLQVDYEVGMDGYQIVVNCMLRDIVVNALMAASDYGKESGNTDMAELADRLLNEIMQKSLLKTGDRGILREQSVMDPLPMHNPELVFRKVGLEARGLRTGGLLFPGRVSAKMYLALN